MGLAFAWLILTLFSVSIQADVFNSRYLYDWGYYGLYPQTRFKSFSLTTPLLNFVQWDDRQCDDGYYLIAPKGKIVATPGPLIVDSRGNLVWTDDRFGVVFDLQVQTYKDEQYLTFWASPDGSSHGYGRGTYYMLDSSYKVVNTFGPIGEGLKGDLHDFRITQDGTILMTVYNPVPADLTSIGGPEKGWALDCMFQEIDIETGDLLFQWNVIQHVDVNDTIRYFAGEDDGTAPESAFDFFHINSVDKDDDGNYIISGRHTHTIICVSPQGTILWTLGGKKNDFRDLSEGHATDFTYQHHVRLHDNYTLSIFDNAKAERSGPDTPYHYSRGLLIQLDTEAMTATLVQEYFDPQSPKYPDSQGSAQVMDDRVVIGYGYYPAVTEFSLDGEVLCDFQLAPSLVARWGLVTSYRAFKTRDWTGQPSQPPAIFLKPSDGELFVSWNGATEVDRWVLQGAEWDDLEDERFVELKARGKEEFETGFEIDNSMPQYLRVAALGRDGKVLKHSVVLDRRVGNAPSHLVRNIVTGLCVSAIVAVIAVVLFRSKGLRKVKWSFVDTIASFMLRWRRSERPSLRGFANMHAKSARWWKDWRSARAHELQPLYDN
ncbi:Arylsulfotransferase-domain-containing protein [Biscogniauxia mediterranea]|nr:Arylsulfotransferase-domain-containing protein [Biscogniauxia mediterranea]